MKNQFYLGVPLEELLPKLYSIFDQSKSTPLFENLALKDGYIHIDIGYSSSFGLPILTSFDKNYNKIMNGELTVLAVWPKHEEFSLLGFYISSYSCSNGHHISYFYLIDDYGRVLRDLASADYYFTSFSIPAVEFLLDSPQPPPMGETIEHYFLEVT